MAWEARLGLKPCFLLLCLPLIEGLNGLGSPSGIETLHQRELSSMKRPWLNGLGSPSGIETISFPLAPVCSIRWLNGLGSPSGIETLRQLLESTADLAG